MFDVVIVGGGIAGLMSAMEISRFCRVLVITKTNLPDSNSRYAQGGIAFAIGEDDSVDLHVADTLKAGAGLCVKDAVQLLVEEGRNLFSQLEHLGARFDYIDGRISLHREGGHSSRRVVNAGDATGAEVVRALSRAAMDRENITILEQAFLVGLVTDGNRCTGVRIYFDGREHRVEAKAVVLATGGAGQVFGITTNPEIATGDGVAAAARAGARLADMEFFQFHPTVLYEDENPRFLITEAIRGVGAYILDHDHHRIMLGVHPLAELAPRDIVSKTMATVLREKGLDYLFLDVRHIDRDIISTKFPNIESTLRAKGIDVFTELIPVSYAAHYMCGGVVTNLDGCTSVRNLYACGEVACTGVHGANRLASNSLLEALGYSKRIAQHLRGNLRKEDLCQLSSDDDFTGEQVEENPFDWTDELKALRTRMTKIIFKNVGVFRNANQLSEHLETTPDLAVELNNLMATRPFNAHTLELLNMLTVSDLICRSALLRTESRGTHQREDYPEPQEHWENRHILYENDGVRTTDDMYGDIDW